MSAPQSPNDSTNPTDVEPAQISSGAAPASLHASPEGGGPLSLGERAAVGTLSLVQAAVFAWGHVLPWDKASAFVVLCSLLSLVHLSTAVCCAIPAVPWRWRLGAWALASAVSAGFLGWTTWAMTTSAWYLIRLYGGLGQGMGAVLMGVWGLVAFLTLPLLVWGLYRSRGVWRSYVGVRPAMATGAAVCLIASVAAVWYSRTAAPEHRARDAGTESWSATLRSVSPIVKAANAGSLTGSNVTINHKLRAKCKANVENDTPATVLVHYADREGKPQLSCLQSESTETLGAELEQWLSREVGPGPVVLDRLTAVRPLSGAPRWLEALSLRPGVDGACLRDRCYAPWQLVAQSRFVTHTPLPFLADLKFGASLSDLARGLSDKKARQRHPVATNELLAFTSQSAVIAPDGEVTPLVRMHPIERPLTAEQVAIAAAQFETHIVSAQQESGQFRYTLDPFTRVEENRELNLARQAGTVFALCDVGSPAEGTTQAARRGLQLLIDRHREDGDVWALAGSPKDRYVRLGESALPLVALLTCRSRIGNEFDAAIAGLSRFVLTLQRNDGSFATDYDWKRKRTVAFGEALYAPGQALLALTLLDRLVAEHPELGALGDPRVLTTAIQRGMDHVAHEHWNVPIYPFFFVEENWNCLTARAALARQRNPDYERFCLDYVAFKSRLIFSDDSDVAPEFVGGFGFGNLIPPHNTGAAGFGEALSASITVLRARGQSTTEQERVLCQLLEFLLRQQWTQATCAACTPLAIGSMSEHIHSPITRIDFGQHAWAALTNGALALGLTATSS